MTASDHDVEAMVVALFTINAGIERARRERRDVSALSMLQFIGSRGSVRPSEIALHRQVNQSLVTRQIREMEDTGYVSVTANPADGRSCLVALTQRGAGELQRLTQIGLARFASFVSDWDPAQVRALTELLEKLGQSMASVNAVERPVAPQRRWARQGAPQESGLKVAQQAASRISRS